MVKIILIMKNKIIYTLVIGILILLGFIVVGDFFIAYKEHRSVDEGIIHLLQITIVGLIGIIGTFFGMGISKDKEDKE